MLLQASGALAVQLKEEGLLSRSAQVTCHASAEERLRATFRQMDPCCMAPDMQGYDAVLMVNLLERCASPKTPLGRALGQAPLVRVGGLILVASTFGWEENVADKKLWLGGFADEATGERVCSAARVREFLERPGATDGAAYELVEEFDAAFAIPKAARAFDIGVSRALIMRRVR